MILEATEQTIEVGQMPTTLEEIVPWLIGAGCLVGFGIVAWILKRVFNIKLVTTKGDDE